MANAITVNTVTSGMGQLQAVFDQLWSVKATISDQDAVAITDTASFSMTVAGVVLGDIVLGVSLTNDLSDGTDQACVTAVVTADDTVVLRVLADKGEYAADDLNTAVVKLVVARPAF